MPLIVDFLLPRRPLSHQSSDSGKKAQWRDYVFGRAQRAWPAKPLLNYPLKFTIVYLTTERNPGDINNFVKPIQDALCGLVYADDSMIRDLSAHLRQHGTIKDTVGFPHELISAIMSNSPCVYIAVSDSLALEKELVWT